jgi:hypothetical protein
MIIRKGTHSPLRFPCMTGSTELVHKVTFTESCRYDIGAEQADVNKLFGIGYLPHHHRNSVRFGWRYQHAGGMVEVLAYWYHEGSRMFIPMGLVSIGTPHVYVMRRHENMHQLYLDKTLLEIPVPAPRYGFLLRPYFGGNMTAPHDIEIKFAPL